MKCIYILIKVLLDIIGFVNFGYYLKILKNEIKSEMEETQVGFCEFVRNGKILPWCEISKEKRQYFTVSNFTFQAQHNFSLMFHF
jgi:hypothetical protein